MKKKKPISYIVRNNRSHVLHKLSSIPVKTKSETEEGGGIGKKEKEERRLKKGLFFGCEESGVVGATYACEPETRES